MRTVADILPASQNNFTLLRLVAATAVIISHAFLQTTGGQFSEPLARLTRLDLGDYAVNIFFIVSGLTVAASLDRSGDLKSYALARIFRIFPALLVCVLATTFLLGPVVTSVPVREYLFSSDLLFYGLKTISLYTANARLPGVFDSLPMASDVNAPVWTLKHEALVYVLLAALFAVTTFRRPSLRQSMAVILPILAVAETVNIGAGNGTVHSATELAFSFMVGVTVYAFRSQIVLDWRIGAALAIIFLFTLGTAFECVASSIVAAVVVLAFGALPLKHLRAATNANDISFGTYLYAWPIAQTVLLTMPGLSAPLLAIVTLPFAWFFGYTSWHLVELPAIRLARSWTPRPVGAVELRPRRTELLAADRSGGKAPHEI